MKLFIVGIFLCLVLVSGFMGWNLLFKDPEKGSKQSSAMFDAYPSITKQENGEKSADLSYIFIYATEKAQISLSDKNHLKVAEGFLQAPLMNSAAETNEGIVMLEFSKPISDEYVLTVSGNTAGGLRVLFYDRNGNVNALDREYSGENRYKILFNKEDSAKSTVEQIQ